MLLNRLISDRGIEGIHRSIINYLNHASAEKNVSWFHVPMKKTLVKVYADQGNHQLLAEVQKIEHCEFEIAKKDVWNALFVKIWINGMLISSLEIKIQVKVAYERTFVIGQKHWQKIVFIHQW